MSWVRLDDQIWTHRKVLAVPAHDRLLYVWAICWASGNGTDGHVPDGPLQLVAFAAGCDSLPDATARLVKAGLWHEAEQGGITILLVGAEWGSR